MSLSNWLSSAIVEFEGAPCQHCGASNIVRHVSIAAEGPAGLGGGGALRALCLDFCCAARVASLARRHWLLKALGGAAPRAAVPGTDEARGFAREVAFYRFAQKLLARVAPLARSVLQHLTPLCLFAAAAPPPLPLPPVCVRERDNDYGGHGDGGGGGGVPGCDGGGDHKGRDEESDGFGYAIVLEDLRSRCLHDSEKQQREEEEAAEDEQEEEEEGEGERQEGKLRADVFTTPSMSRGLSMVEVRRVLDVLAWLHGATWGTEAPPCGALSSAQLGRKCALGCEDGDAICAFAERYGGGSDSSAEPCMSHASVSRFLAVSVAVARAGAARLFAAACDAAGPVCVVHGDVHPLNVMLARGTGYPGSDGGGANDGRNVVVRLVDFADVAHTSGAYDVQQCLSCCLDPATRRSCEGLLVRSYYATLCRAIEAASTAPSNACIRVDFEQIWTAYRCLSVLSCLQIAAFFGAHAAQLERECNLAALQEADDIARPLAERLIASVCDHADEFQFEL